MKTLMYNEVFFNYIFIYFIIINANMHELCNIKTMTVLNVFFLSYRYTYSD